MTMQPTILKSSDEVASNLNLCLADATVFWYALHNHHWFVTGTTFFTLHEKYEEMYTRWVQVVDDLAERLLTIGYKPTGTLKDCLELSVVTEITGNPSPEERVRATLEDLRVMDERMMTLQRQGRIFFYLACTGQEACNVGTAAPLVADDWIVPGYRQLAAGRPRRAIAVASAAYALLLLALFTSWLHAPAGLVWSGVAAGAVLAFFAFIGFEDIVNMAEEVIAPERTLPRAILLSLLITSLLYALVTWAAVRAVPVDRLSVSEQPLALVWSEARGGNAALLSLIAVAAALNGVLAQIVMAARVMFGMGKRNPALGRFHRAHPRFGTPVLATLLIGTLVIAGALTLDVADLAGATSGILLAVFVVVNLALIVQKRRAPDAPFRVPMAVPVLGLVASLVALAGLLNPIGAGS